MNDTPKASSGNDSPTAPDLHRTIARPADWIFLQPDILDLMHDAVITTDMNGTIIGCNRAMQDIYGFTAEEAIGKNVSILYPEEEREFLFNSLVPTVITTGAFRGELRNRTQSGAYIYVHLSVALLRDSDGHPCGMVGFSVNVTAQKLGDLAVLRTLEVERELIEQKSSPARMQILFAAVDRAQDVILLTEAEPIDEPGPRVVYINKAFQRMTGYSPEDIIGKSPRILQGPKSDRAAIRRMRAAMAAWQPIREELINYRKDGSEFWVDMSIFPIANEKGHYTHWMAIQRDTTEQNIIRERLADGESRHRFLTEAIPQLLWTADASGQCTFVSHTCADFLGLPVDACIHGGWYTAVHPDDLAKTYATWTESVRTGSHFMVEYRLRRHDGQYLWFLHRASPRKDAEGRVLEWIGTSTDIALQKRTEEALRQSEKLAAVGRLASSIAHEINNPLAAVTNILYLLNEDHNLAETSRDLIHMAQDELNRISQVTTQSLRFHRQSTVATRTAIADLIDSVLAAYKSRIAQAQIAVDRDYQQSQPVICFADDVRQTIGSIIGNAVEAMTPGGRLRIRKRTTTRWTPIPEKGLRITIADTGTGISREHRSRIFEPFFTTKSATGTGLGLWIAKDLIAKQGGSLTFRSSTKPGASGTVMSIFLPFEGKPAR